MRTPGRFDPGVFGSVARGEDEPGSDIDFLVSPQPGFSLFDHGGLMVELSELLGVEVDVVSDRTVPAELLPSIEAEAIPRCDAVRPNAPDGHSGGDS